MVRLAGDLQVRWAFLQQLKREAPQRANHPPHFVRHPSLTKEGRNISLDAGLPELAREAIDALAAILGGSRPVDDPIAAEQLRRYLEALPVSFAS